MALQVDDIIEFVETWRIENGIANNLELSNDQIIKFVSELQNKIAEMDYSVPEGVTIIGYSGNSNKCEAWKIVAKVADPKQKVAYYISNLPAGELIGKRRDDLESALETVVGEDNVDKIIGGYDSDGKRLKGGSCGFGDDLLSIDDFVSSKLMGEF